MTFDEFKASLTAPSPPDSGELLRALWYEANDDWERAHTIVQEINSSDAAWIHAYLHRKEGDIGNARYWYARAQRPPATHDLAAEWEEIVTELLAERTD